MRREKGMRAQGTEEQRMRAVELRANGLNYREISKQLSVGTQTVCRWLAS
ncbi:helix-turn-helix domain-containing protein [Acidithiobacillus sulfurivorans]|uniref:Helix-turn-helix domain-containing protein n=1 Tax=Acidithiobacillus sulfurivorans TaxID=1958756 RepID=A0ABS6A094_9PROT|nr:helix-turn-helix domain-containing protein [Acidithiobacillus sulfurivorans]